MSTLRVTSARQLAECLHPAVLCVVAGSREKAAQAENSAVESIEVRKRRAEVKTRRTEVEKRRAEQQRAGSR